MAPPVEVGDEERVPLPDPPPSWEPVGGRLMQFAGQWERVTQDPWVLETVAKGYKIEFTGKPRLTTVPRWTPVPRSRARKAALEDGLDKLLAKKAIRLVGPPPAEPGFYSTLFLVEKKSGGWRPILNLKGLNRKIKPTKFKMDTLRVILKSLGESFLSHQLIHQHDPEAGPLDPHAVSVDLEDAYFHVAIRPEDRKFLRFAYNGKVYEFLVLPFGLSTAPRTFTRIVRSVAVYLKTQGVDMFQYLDDWLLFAMSLALTARSRELTLECTRRLGFLINMAKSDLTPSVRPGFLGSDLDLLNRHALPSQERVRVVTGRARGLLRPGAPRARQWRSLLGHLASLVDLVPHARAHMRAIQLNLSDHWTPIRDPDSMRVPHTEDTIRELRWWAEPGNLTLGVPFLAPSPTVTIVTDASHEGWGGHLGERVASGTWTRLRHINYLELQAVWLTMAVFLPELQGTTVEVLTDSMTAAAYINKEGGTHSMALCILALEFLKWCSARGITPIATHIAGISNVLADALSRGRHNHPTEWTLAKRVVRLIFQTWETPWVDLFASDKNHHLPVFYSALPSRKSSGVNALTQDWTALIGYAYPPIRMIPRVLEKILRNPSAKVYLVAPFWPSQIWFRNLVDLLIDHPRLVPVFPELVRNSETGMLYPDPKGLRLTVWPLSGNPGLRQGFRRQLQRQLLNREDHQLMGFTLPVSVDSSTGAVREIWIPLRPL